MPAPCWNRMLLRPCWTRPSCQCHDCLGPARAAQGYWAITNSNILCPMSGQSPALPHCHSLPLAMSLMRLPREHCTIINYIIIITVIAWGCPQPGCPCCHLPPSTQRHQGAASPAARAPTRPSTSQQPCSPWRCQQSQGGTEGISLPRPTQALLSPCLPTSLFLKSCTSPTKSRAGRE